LSQVHSSTFGENYNAPCSAVSAIAEYVVIFRIHCVLKDLLTIASNLVIHAPILTVYDVKNAVHVHTRLFYYTYVSAEMKRFSTQPWSHFLRTLGDSENSQLVKTNAKHDVALRSHTIHDAHSFTSDTFLIIIFVLNIITY